MSYAIRTEGSLHPIYKKLSLVFWHHYKSITYVIRTEESLHPVIKKFRWVPILSTYLFDQVLHWLTYIVIVNITHIRHCFS